MSLRLSFSILALFSLGAALLPANHRPHKTQNVIFVMTDGLRWQEVFRGADDSLMNGENGVADLPRLQRLYGNGSSKERRRQLMPFLWSAVARSGQIYGNRDNGSDAFVTNGLNFSYPATAKPCAVLQTAAFAATTKYLIPM